MTGAVASYNRGVLQVTPADSTGIAHIFKDPRASAMSRLPNPCAAGSTRARVGGGRVHGATPDASLWGCLPISNGTPSSCVEKHGGPAMQRQKARIGSTEREHAHMHRMDVGDPCSHRGLTWVNINHQLYTYIELAASELPTWAQRARDRELTGRRRRQPPPRHSAACAAAGRGRRGRRGGS